MSFSGLERHRFRFRLRTLLIVVALLAIPDAYVRHQVKIIEARKDWIATHNVTVVTWNSSGLGIPPSDEHDGPSILRRLLGDEDYYEISLISPRDKSDAEKLFPEAHCFAILAQ